MKKVRKHKLFNKPVLAMFIMILWGGMVLTSIGTGFDMAAKAYTPDYLGGAWVAVMALVGLAIHRLIFRREFNGNLRLKNTGRGLLLLLPLLAFIVLNLTEIDFGSLSSRTVIFALLAGMGPGFIEEVTYRGLPGSNFMRVWNSEDKLILTATLPSALFGLVHIANIVAGAGVSTSLIQAVYAFGVGVLFAAVYYRTGTLWPCLIAHSLVDFTAYLNPEMAASGGVMVDNGFDPLSLILAAAGIAYAVLGYWYLRPAKRGEIVELWSKKWVRPIAEEPAYMPDQEETVNADPLE